MSELIEREAVQEMMKAEQVELQELSHRRLEYDDAMYASINARIRLIITLREQIEYLPSALRAAQPLTREFLEDLISGVLHNKEPRPAGGGFRLHLPFDEMIGTSPFRAAQLAIYDYIDALLDSLADKGGE